jgi:hypothetical protein
MILLVHGSVGIAAALTYRNTYDLYASNLAMNLTQLQLAFLTCHEPDTADYVSF